MAHKRQLKQKDVERLRELQWKHPGELSVEEQAEKDRLEKLSLKYGEATK